MFKAYKCYCLVVSLAVWHFADAPTHFNDPCTRGLGLSGRELLPCVPSDGFKLLARVYSLRMHENGPCVSSSPQFPTRAISGDRGTYLGLFPLTVTVTTRGNRNYNSPLIRPPLRTVTGWGNDPIHTPHDCSPD